MENGWESRGGIEYRPYVPERWESKNGEGDDAERIANSLLVR